jgi:hypothetical protein
MALPEMVAARPSCLFDVYSADTTNPSDYLPTNQPRSTYTLDVYFNYLPFTASLSQSTRLSTERALPCRMNWPGSATVLEDEDGTCLENSHDTEQK